MKKDKKEECKCIECELLGELIVGVGNQGKYYQCLTGVGDIPKDSIDKDYYCKFFIKKK